MTDTIRTWQERCGLSNETTARDLSYSPMLAEIAELRAALAQQAGQVQGWQPIETAPKDGTLVLVFRSLRSEPQIEGARYRADIDAWGNGSWRYPENAGPTHWMPLPTAPKRS